MYIHSCLVLHIYTISSSPAASAIMLLLCSFSSHQTLTSSVVAEVEVQSSGTSLSNQTTSVSYVFPVTAHTHTTFLLSVVSSVQYAYLRLRISISFWIMSVLEAEIFANCVHTYIPTSPCTPSLLIQSTISSSSLPVMVPVIMNPSKPVSSLPQPEQRPPPPQATLGQQDILNNLQNAKLLQSLLQVASTLPTQPLLPVGPVGQGLTAPLNLQSLLQGVPPASSGFLPIAQPVGQVDTTQLSQSAKSTMHPGSQSSVASSPTLPLQQTQSANLLTAVGEEKKTTLPLTVSVGSWKSATPNGPRRTPLAQVNTNVTPVHTFSMLKPALRTEGYLAGVTGYHDNSAAYPVLLAEQWEVGGDRPPPLGDGGTLGQRDTQTAKETI